MIADYYEDMCDDLWQIRQHINNGLDDGGEPPFHVCVRHGYVHSKKMYKVSFRPFISEFRIRYTDIPNLIAEVGQTDYWDMEVYKPSQQLLSTIYGHKGVVRNGFCDERRLLPESQEVADQDPLLYIAQYVQNKWKVLKPKAPLYTRDTAATIDTSHIDRIQSYVDQAFVIDLLACMCPQTATNRYMDQDWDGL